LISDNIKGESKESEMKTCWLGFAVDLALLDGCLGIALVPLATKTPMEA
jgi:hypothetical protein